MRSALLAACVCFSVLPTSLAYTQKPATKESPQPAPTSLARVSYDGEALIVQQWDIGFRYNSDGTGEQTQHLRVKLQNEAGIRQFSVISVAYAASTQTAQFQDLTVTHADGTTTSTPPSDAIDMPAPVTQEAPLYSDLKVLQLPVRGLRAGDILDYRMRIQFKTPEAPSQFWGDFTFDTTQVVLAQTLTLDIPADKYVQVWSPKHKPTITTADGRRFYRWSGNQLKPTSPDKKKDDKTPPKPTDNKPSAAWTTFHSWQEVGDWYRSLAAPRATPTDALRAQAEEITRNAKTPEDQIAAIYTFVSTRIRYIGIDFGIGRFEPHPAAQVLANQYGDCKDKDTLLEALLRAKGFTTAPALIGVNVDMIPDLPSPGLFNHVITTATLPSGQIWMDSTPGFSPFRLLVSPIRDKQALVIPATGTAKLETTPAQPPFPSVNRFEAKATLNGDGELNAHVDITDRSDVEIVLRALGRNLAPAQWDQGTQYLVRLLGFGGTTSNSDFAKPDDFTAPMHVSYDYNRKPYGDWDNLRIVPLLPTTLGLPAAPDKQPADKIELGAQRTDIAVSTIKLPANFSANLPDAIHVKTPFATFDQTYSLNNGELTCKRTIVVLESKLPATSWQQYKKFSDDASLGTLPFIQLTSTTAGRQHLPKPTASNPVAAQLITQVNDIERKGDWDSALKKLDAAKLLQPDQPYLWSNYGFIAMRQRKNNEAKKDFRHELELHPDEDFVVTLYAGFLHFLHEDAEAQSVLSAYFSRNPAQDRVALMLASLQAESSVTDAIATLRKALTASPKNHTLQVLLASDLVRNHQNAEATDIAKKQLDGATEPMALNSASYVLAQTGLDLPLAEQKARAALDTLSTQSAQAGIGEANAQSFQRTSLLIATWDTLGDILSQENKLDEARDYLAAAWANEQEAPIAAHYGRVLEKLHQPGEALRVYELAPKPQVITDADALLVPAAITRLKKSGVRPVSDGATVTSTQEKRTFALTLKSAHKDFVSSTFRLQISSSGIQAVQRVGGSDQLDEANTAIRALHLPQLVPTHSTARILRDAIVTCSPNHRDCYFVLMPLGGIQAERVGE